MNKYTRGEITLGAASLHSPENQVDVRSVSLMAPSRFIDKEALGGVVSWLSQGPFNINYADVGVKQT